jgi:mannose-6-phosphate isomerase-like protein (cupin superfamily)
LPRNPEDIRSMATLLHDPIAHPEIPFIATPSGPYEAPLRRGQLVRLVADLARDPSNWQGHVRHEPDRRWWTRLMRHEHFDAWLISWPGQEATDLHDHGGSAAALTVVEGTLEHVLASRGGELSRETLSAGTLLAVEPGAVHDVRNPTALPAVSIHVYSPPLERMTYFRPDGAGLAPVRTVYGDQPEMELSW